MQGFVGVTSKWHYIWVLIHERNKITSTFIWNEAGKIQIGSWHLLCLMSKSSVINEIILSEGGIRK